MMRFCECASCGAEQPLGGHTTEDMSEWVSYPEGWLLLERNGVTIAACSVACAEAYIRTTFRNRPA